MELLVANNHPRPRPCASQCVDKSYPPCHASGSHMRSLTQYGPYCEVSTTETTSSLYENDGTWSKIKGPSEVRRRSPLGIAVMSMPGNGARPPHGATSNPRTVADTLFIVPLITPHDSHCGVVQSASQFTDMTNDPRCVTRAVAMLETTMSK